MLVLLLRPGAHVEEQGADPAPQAVLLSFLSFKAAFASLVNPFIQCVFASPVSRALRWALGREEKETTVSALTLFTVGGRDHVQ